MNNNLQKLIQVSQKENRNIIGLMSGTSLDGLDIALCNISGTGVDTKVSLLQFTTIPYEVTFQEDLKKLLSKQVVDLKHLCQMNQKIGKKFALHINDAIQKWNYKREDIDAIASHGQTIFHAPSCDANTENSTLQIGDGDQIAYHTGILTISDFRQKHIAAGGQGAPLVAYGDYLLFKAPHLARILLNIGGISNCTFIPARADFEQLICTDIGPGNTLIDNWVCAHFNDITFDQNAIIARKGKVNYVLLEQLLSNSFFKKPFPKTTGQELFNLQFVENALNHSKTNNISNEDILATLTAFTANVIINAIDTIVPSDTNFEILISGGGYHNPLIMEYLYNHFDNITIRSTAQLNIHPDAKEAVLFALLANETLAGDPKTFENKGNKNPAVQMGKISFPH